MPVKMITEPQVNLLLKLAGERELGVSGPEMKLAIEGAELTCKAAGEWITAAMAKPYKPRESAKPGYYKQGGEFIVVVSNKAKTNTYAKKLVITGGEPVVCQGHFDVEGAEYYCPRDEEKPGELALCAEGTPRKKAEWVYAPGLGFKVADLEPLSLEEATEFSYLHGFCMICCKALKNPKSVKKGLGPVCAKKVQRA